MLNLEIGTVLWVEATQPHPAGVTKVRPGIVVDKNDYGEVRVVLGSSQRVQQKKMHPGEFIVTGQDELEALGLPKATRFSWKFCTWASAARIRGVIGQLAQSVGNRAILAQMAIR